MLDMPVKAGIFATEQMINVHYIPYLLMHMPRKFGSKCNFEVSCESIVQLRLKAIKKLNHEPQ